MLERIQQLLLKMQDQNIDAMLIGSGANRRYISGFTGSNAMLYLSSKRQVLITDFRYIEQAKIESHPFEIINQTSKGLIGTALQIAKEDSARYIGFESDHTNYTSSLEFSKYPSFEFIPTKHLIEQLRQIKDDKEIEALRKAEHIGDLAFSHIVDFIKSYYKQGLTEKDVALEIEYRMRKKGAEGISFNAIVAGGTRSALPHAQPTDQSFKPGDFIVLDFGCIYQGYCSDMTRTMIIGEPTKKQSEIYQTVLHAQLEALKCIKPGVLGKEVDQVARDIITQAGYGTYFGHGLGHSTGLEIHENPRFSPLETTMIQKGMVITVEPGIYVPHLGGVRIEDLVVITEDGMENLTHSTKELIIIH